MIKSNLLLILLFLCNLSTAQKQFVEKTYSTEYEEGCKEVSVNSGKPVFIVVYISNSIPNDSLIAVREFNELKKNFKGSNFYFLQTKGKIKFSNSNKEVLDFDEVNSSYEKIIYWNGKKESDFIEYDKIVQSSEYFSEVLNVSKTSSYIDDYNAKINDFRSQLVWEPNEKSKELSDKYLKNKLFEQLKAFEDFSDFLNLDFKGVKKLVVNSNLSKKNPWQEIYFNKDGLPTKAIVTSDDSDGNKGTINYEYKDNLLSKITVSYKSQDGEVYEYSTDIYYSGQNLIASGDSRLIFYSTNSGFLTYKSYYMNEMNYEFLIDTYELIKGKELVYTESSKLNNAAMSFNSKENFLPVVYTLRPEAKNDKHVSVLTKKDDLNYAVTRENVAYIKIKYLNKNLVSEVLLIDPDDISRNKKMNQYKFDFKYEYYK
ncbi:hypothetical protein [uncultured Flavobacterium sp.]|uniref:hypothetical protein n=1 Tax=uncultured Flavobacterium sp. TaxID=165435 RepID=UPI0025EA5EB9|nr:hypothetical protein [uncultured Flavobacterium sp.]